MPADLKRQSVPPRISNTSAAGGLIAGAAADILYLHPAASGTTVWVLIAVVVAGLYVALSQARYRLRRLPAHHAEPTTLWSVATGHGRRWLFGAVGFLYGGLVLASGIDRASSETWELEGSLRATGLAVLAILFAVRIVTLLRRDPACEQEGWWSATLRVLAAVVLVFVAMTAWEGVERHWTAGLKGDLNHQIDQIVADDPNSPVGLCGKEHPDDFAPCKVVLDEVTRRALIERYIDTTTTTTTGAAPATSAP